MSLVVGIDLATAAVRAVASDASGTIHAAAERALPAPVSPQPGWSEADPALWWPAAADAVREVVAHLGAGTPIAAVSVSGTSGTAVVLDAAGRPVGPALMYADQRAAADAALAGAAAAERWTRLGLRIQPSFGLPKWAWLLRTPAVAEAAARLAHAPDVIVGRLVDGLPPTDWSHALKSGYDPVRGEWVSGAFEALGIPEDLLPEVRPPGALAGTVGEAAARTCGLPAGCDVRLGMTDSCAAQLAAGAGSPGRFVSVLGTTLVLKGATPHLVADAAGAVYSHRHPGGWWLPGGASNVGAGVLPATFPGRALAELDEEAARRGPARTVAYPLVGTGERFPFVAPDAQAFMSGEPADDAERYRSLLEGVAFVERLGYERLALLGAAPDGPVAVTGGGSRSLPWVRIRATVLGRPLLQVAGATTALGAAILAASGTLHDDLEAATRAMARSGRVVDPDPSEGSALEASYLRFRAAVEERGWLPAGPSR